jgi:hypothetical protein
MMPSIQPVRLSFKETGELTLQDIVESFARGIELADSRCPQVITARSGRAYQPGIGPHSEPAAIKLIMQELAEALPEKYSRFRLGVPFPNSPRMKCDLSLADSPPWHIEVKMARFRGDNGKPADETLMHLISPYETDRSALTDCSKLAASGFPGRLAVLIYGFDFHDKPLDPVIDAFESLASARCTLGKRISAPFSGLVHPVHRMGRVFAWEINPHEPRSAER